MSRYREHVVNLVNNWYASKFRRWYTPEVEREVIIGTFSILNDSMDVDDTILAKDFQAKGISKLLEREPMIRRAQAFFGHAENVLNMLEAGLSWSNSSLDREYIWPCGNKVKKIVNFIDAVEKGRRLKFSDLDRLFLNIYEDHSGFTGAYFSYLDAAEDIATAARLAGFIQKNIDECTRMRRVLKISISLAHEEVLTHMPISLRHTSYQL